MLCRELEEAGAVMSGGDFYYWVVREGLSQEVTLKQTAKGSEGTEHPKIKGEKILGRENKV